MEIVIAYTQKVTAKSCEIRFYPHFSLGTERKTL